MLQHRIRKLIMTFFKRATGRQKTIATIGHFQLIHYVKIELRRGSAPDPAGGAYSAPPDPLAGFKGPYF